MRYSINTIKTTLEVKDISPNKACSSQNAYNILEALYSNLEPDQEHFSILALDSKLNLIGFKILFSGGQTSSQVDLKILFRNAILLGAVKTILAHNHPSLDPTPSIEDVNITNLIVDAGNILDIKVLDHIILGSKNKYCSMRESQLMKGE